MDYNRERDVVQIITNPNINNTTENWGSGPALDQSMWATEDEYGDWNREASVDTTSSNHDSRSGSEPPSKKPKPSQSTENRSKMIGKMFFKTKLCCKFRAGTCPYITNCNFAHSIEELRRPPPNWQDIVAANDEEREEREPREAFQIPSVVSSPFGVDSQRSYKGRHCKKFFTEEGCPYGENCTFLHDEQSKTRESVAISLGPGSGGNYGNNNNNGNNNAGVVTIKPSNWKTRICNKWEITGYCPFGSKCHFAHGAQELHRYGGGLMEGEGGDSGSAPQEAKQGAVPSKNPTENTVTPLTSVPYADAHHISGVPSQRLSNAVIPRAGPRALQKWKGPDKISLIYGDWIDDIE